MPNGDVPARRFLTVLVVALLATTLGVVPATAYETGAIETSGTGTATVQESETCDFDALFDDAIASVVTIRVFDQGGERGLGSGWVYARNDTSTLVVTNAHVVDNGLGADVRFRDGEWATVDELVGIDRYADLAVLRVTDAPAYADSLAVASTTPEEGDEVAAIGSPLGLEGSMTTGVVSAVNRSITVGEGQELYTVVDALQIDAPINPGNSGGPLLDCRGNVTGVNFAGVDPLAGQNLNFAISASMIERVVPSLVANGTYNHSYLGVRAVTLSPTISRVNGVDPSTQGVLIESVVAGAPADGVLRGSATTERVTSIAVGGDVVLAVDGRPVGDVDELRDVLFESTRPGETVEITVLRNGTRETLSVTLASRPLPRERAAGEAPSI